MSPTRIAIECFDTPSQVTVDQPGEKRHERKIDANSSYEFMVNEGASIKVGAIDAASLHPDDKNERPSRKSKPHSDQTSGTSELQNQEREPGAFDPDLDSPFATDHKIDKNQSEPGVKEKAEELRGKDKSKR